MMDLNLTAQLLVGKDVDEAALTTEIETAGMKNKPFFGPACEETKGRQLEDALKKAMGDEEPDVQENRAARVRMLLDHAQNIATNSEQRKQLVGHLKHLVAQDQEPEPTPSELRSLAVFLRATHGLQVNLQEAKWNPIEPTLAEDADRNTTAQPIVLPKAPGRDERRHLEKRARGRRPADTEADHRHRDKRGDQRAQDASRVMPQTAQVSKAAVQKTAMTSADIPSAVVASSAPAGSGGGGPNTAHAEINIHLPPGTTWPAPPPPPAPNAPALDAEAMRRVFAEGQAHLLDETRRMVDGVRQANELAMDDVLEAMKKLQDEPVKKPFWNIGFSWAKALIAFLLLLGILGITWWTFQPAEHTRNVTTKLDSRSPSSP